MSATLTSDFEKASLVAFPCRRCQTELTAIVDRDSQWVRCPNCGQGNLPPKPLSDSEANLFGLENDRDESSLQNGAFKRPESKGLDRSPSYLDGSDPFELASRTNIRRVVASTVLFIAIMMLVFSILDQNSNGGTVFGSISLVAVVVLAWPVSRPPIRPYDRR